MSAIDKYNHISIENKWQEKWLKEGTFSPNIKTAKKPFYNLMMFPYPSAEGLHVGNMYAFTGADVYGRFKRMNGYDVLEPIGLDGFGIHSENYAIKVGRHPKEHAEISQKNFYKQLHMIGGSFDWEKTLETYDPNYYKWTQWLFIQMFKAGLAYKDRAIVNWCPTDKTVLSDEQVEGGKCERCGSEVTKRSMSSWFFRITNYADRLLDNIEEIKWPEKIKIAQKNWIGKSQGMIINFKNEDGSDIPVFTTRPDTLNAVTFIATSDETMYDEKNETKIGEFTGKYAINPFNNKKVPIWKTNYVAPRYGTGVVMGVPAHDDRDMDFANKYHLDIIKKEPDEKLWKLIEKNKWGKIHTNYHLRDWGISRQRYWGPPIPMINCKDCGWQPVPESDLPVLLPDIKEFKPQGDGTSPLHNAPESWKKVKCPKCGETAERELDVSDTFLDSSWYFLAYPNLGTEEWGGNESPLNKEITKKWLPVNTYIGGAEHAVLHLLYARFVTMFLKDQGFIDFEEPFPFLFGHGLIIKDGAKMSKSKGNVVNPDEYINKFGADTLRTYLMFLGPYDQGGDFRDSGIEGMGRFIQRVWKTVNDPKILADSDRKDVYNKLHQTIKKITDDVSNFKYNTAISALMELLNLIQDKGADSGVLKVLCQMLSLFAPHITEELWVNVLHQPFSIHTSNWPEHDAKYLKVDQVTIVVQINGKLRSQLAISNSQFSKEEIESLARKDEKVFKWLDGKEIKKTIFIPGKLINFVI
ncbi:MAG TPA: class I tRNA ligase family protein [Patescibacteria group bacterium]|nr:class I tRNA ligase family protein [Patescibacteria group bacterium]